MNLLKTKAESILTCSMLNKTKLHPNQLHSAINLLSLYSILIDNRYYNLKTKNMKTRTILIILIFVILSFQVFGQFAIPTKESVTEIMNRKLIVLIFEKGKNVEQLNKVYKDIVNEYWTFHKDIEFLTIDEAFEKIESANDDYVLLNSEWSEYSHSSSSFRGGDLKTKTTSASTYIFCFDVLKKTVKKKKTDYWMESLYRMPSMNPAVNTADLTFVIKQLNYRFDAVLNGTTIQDKKYNINSVKTRTLLIHDKMLTFDEKEIAEYYKDSYKIVDSVFIEQAVKDKSSKYTYLTVIFSTGFQIPLFALIETDSQKIVSIVAAGGFKAMKMEMPMGFNKRGTVRDYETTFKLKAKYFKYFDMEAAQKTNYRE